ncbi:hypothetical protein ACR9EG_13660, partial [Lactococcus lactis]
MKRIALLTVAGLLATSGTALAQGTRGTVQEGLDQMVQAGVLGAQIRVTRDGEHFTARSGKA